MAEAIGPDVTRPVQTVQVKRMEPEVASAVMVAAGLEPLGPYPGKAVVPWPCRCLECGSDVSPTYNAVQQGKGCRVCAVGHRAEAMRLDPSEAVRRMRVSGAEPLVPYPGAFAKWKCRCSSCGRTVTPLLNNVSRGRGPCKWCGKVKQANTRRIDPALAEAAVRNAGAAPLEPYSGLVNEPWKCRCLKCGRTITPRPSGIILRGVNACAYCAGARTDPAVAVEIMSEAGFEPLDPYVNARTPWRSRCVRCGRESAPWFMSVRAGSGCGYCGHRSPNHLGHTHVAPNRLGPEEACERMRVAGVEPDGPYPGKNGLPWPGRCIRCGSVVNASLATATSKRGKGGCRACADRARGDAQRVPPEEAVRTMRQAGAEPLEPYVDGGTPWRCRCMKCDREVTPKLWVIRQGVGPCSACSVYGFDRVAPAIVYVVTHPVLNALKVGVAGVESTRLKQHRAIGWEVYRTTGYPSGAMAHAVEQAVIRWMRDEKGWPQFLSEGSGKTETVDADLVTALALWRQVTKQTKLLAPNA